ncbi:MAG: MmcQ/YjbR family DNA-binding protein [Thermoplasmatota archaeon]
MYHDSVAFEGRDLAVLEEVRKRCLAYPETVEVEQFGHPWFKAGKRPFCIVSCRPALTIAFTADKMDQAAICQMDHFRPTPYMHQHGWVTYDVPDDVDWDLVGELLESGYRKVALARMIKKLEE